MTTTTKKLVPSSRAKLLAEAEVARRKLAASVRALRAAGINFFDRAEPLDQALLDDCRVYSDRKRLLAAVSAKGGIVAEIGVDKGEFSRYILDTLSPVALHLFDIAPARIDPANLAEALASGLAQLHVGDSSSSLGAFPDEHFDLIYVDGDHSYDGVLRDILTAEMKIKPGGLMIMNDYAAWSPSSMSKCGVAKATNQFANQRRWRVVAMALQGAGYFDMALRKPMP